jgi:hypothetical protein
VRFGFTSGGCAGDIQRVLCTTHTSKEAEKKSWRVFEGTYARSWLTQSLLLLVRFSDLPNFMHQEKA